MIFSFSLFNTVSRVWRETICIRVFPWTHSSEPPVHGCNFTQKTMSRLRFRLFPLLSERPHVPYNLMPLPPLQVYQRQHRPLPSSLSLLAGNRPIHYHPGPTPLSPSTPPCVGFWDVVIRSKVALGNSLSYDDKVYAWVVGYSVVSSPTNNISPSRYCIFIGGNLMSCKRQKQTIMAMAETEYQAMPPQPVSLYGSNSYLKSWGLEILRRWHWFAIIKQPHKLHHNRVSWNDQAHFDQLSFY